MIESLALKYRSVANINFKYRTCSVGYLSKKKHRRCTQIHHRTFDSSIRMFQAKFKLESLTKKNQSNETVRSARIAVSLLLLLLLLLVLLLLLLLVVLQQRGLYTPKIHCAHLNGGNARINNHWVAGFKISLRSKDKFKYRTGSVGLTLQRSNGIRFGRQRWGTST